MEKFEIEKIKNELKKSPIFNFSLGSKELFHSNFIAWIANKYPERTGKLFSRFLKDKSGDISIARAERELKKKDLHLFFTNGQELIIENKVKSIPSLEQLESYSKESLKNQNFLLLTLVQSRITRNTKWSILTYAELADLMVNFYSGVNDVYYKQIIQDYIFVISSLGKIVENIIVEPNDKYDFYSANTDNIFEILSSLRLGSMYQRLKYQKLANRIYEKLVIIFPEAKIYFKDEKKEQKEGCFYIDSGAPPGRSPDGFMEVVYVIKKGLFLTVQIQGKNYRQMVQGYAGYGKDSKKIADSLRAKKLWFNFNHIYKDPKEYPRGDKAFNRYGEIDFYRSVSLNSEFTVDQIVRFVVHDIEVIKKKQNAINKLV